MTSSSSDHPTHQMLVHYADDELSKGERREIERHIAKCYTCRQVVEGLSSQALLDRIREAERDPDPATSGLLESYGLDTTADAGGNGQGRPASGRTLPEIPGFKTVREIGEGGMGTVYLVKNLLMDREEAMKVIKNRVDDPDMIERFRNEIQVIAKLQHPNIVKAWSAAEHGGLVCLFMEYFDGKDLKRHVEVKGPMKWRNACGVIGQVARGLRVAHENNIVHRDIKPSNIISTKSQDKHVVKVLDFGLARLIPDQMIIDPATGRQSTGQVVVGTPHFMSPEQITNSNRVDFRADIYSLGCTFYFLLAGREPFGDIKTNLAILAAHMTQVPLSLTQIRDDLPAGLPEIVEKMMHKEPGRRFQSAIELESALMMLLNGQNSPPPITPNPRPRPPASPNTASAARKYHCASCGKDTVVPEGIPAQVDYCPHCWEPFQAPPPRKPVPVGPGTPTKVVTVTSPPAPAPIAVKEPPAPHDSEFFGTPDVVMGWSVRYGDIGLAVKLIRAELSVWVLSSLACIVASMLTYIVYDLFKSNLLTFNDHGLFRILVWGGFSGVVAACMIRQALRQIDGEELQISDFLHIGSPWGHVLAAGILTSPATYMTLLWEYCWMSWGFFGLILAVPGFIVLIIALYFIHGWIYFTFPLMIDGRIGPEQGIRQSLRLLRRYPFRAPSFSVWCWWFSLMGSIFLLAGLLFTFPIAYLAFAVQYRRCFAAGGKMRPFDVENPAEEARGVKAEYQTKGRFPTWIILLQIPFLMLDLVVFAAVSAVFWSAFNYPFKGMSNYFQVPKASAPRSGAVPPAPVRPGLIPNGNGIPPLLDGFNKFRDQFNRNQLDKKADPKSDPALPTRINPP